MAKKDEEQPDVDKLISVDKDERDRLMAARKKKGLTQRDLALKLGVKQATISNLETGRHPQIRRSTYVKMRRILAKNDGTTSAESEEATYREIVDALPHLTAKDQRAVAALVNSLKKPT